MRNIPKVVKHLFRIALLTIFLAGYNCEAYSQQEQPSKIEVEVSLLNGQRFTGVLKEETDTYIVLLVQDIGEMTIEKSRIRQIKNVMIREMDVDKNGFPVDYHNSTRYLISPSGYGLRKGQAYYENIYLFFNSFAYGISDNISIAGGMEIAQLLFGGDTPIFYLSPRISFPIKGNKGALSTGVIFFSIPENDFDAVGLAQVALTLGSRNNNINFGGGIGFTTDNSSTVYMFNLSANQRLSKKFSFVTDNFLFTEGNFDDDDEDYYVISAALRIHFGKPGTAINVGLWRPLHDTGDLIALPMISATIPLD